MEDDINFDGINDGQHADIFDQVKASVKGFLTDVPRGSTVLIIPFGDTINPDNVRKFQIGPGGGRADAQTYVDSLVADNRMTHLTESVKFALDRLQQLQVADSNRQHYQTLLLYTDGEGNGPGDRDTGGNFVVDEFLNAIEAFQADQPFLFVKYLALGTTVPGKDRLTGAGVEVIEQPSGQVPQLRELRLDLVGANLGAFEVGESRQTRLCPVAGGLDPNLRFVFTVDQDTLPQDLSVQVAPPITVIGEDGVTLTWALSANNADAATALAGSYEVFLDVMARSGADDEGNAPDVVLSPQRFAVQFTIIPSPTPTPLSTATATPLPTATSSPTPLPTSTPPPTSTPTPLPTATSTPLPTFTPTPTPPPTPTSTPSPVVAMQQNLPLDLGRQDVSRGDDPSRAVEWSGMLSAQLLNGATAKLSFAPDHDPPVTFSGEFRVAGSERPQIVLDTNTSGVELVIRSSADDLWTLTDGETTLHGVVVADTGGAPLTAPNATVRDDGTYALPLMMTARVSVPVNYTPLMIGIAGVAGALAVLRALFAARPGLPAGARFEVGTGKAAQRFPLQQGKPFGKAIGLRSSLGTVSGNWGFSKIAQLVPTRDVMVNGQPRSKGQSVPLTPGTVVQVDGQRLTYRQGAK
jgi:hypothetical protein